MADVLDLTTEHRTPDTVRIDGKSYPIVSIHDLSIREQQKMRQLSDRITKLEERNDLADEDYDELDRLVDELFDMVMPKLPNTVKKKLSTWQRMQVPNAFFTRRLREAAAMAVESGEPTPSSSPDSSDSTAGHPETG